MTGKGISMVGLAVALSLSLMAQDTLVVTHAALYDFIQYDSNIIHNDEYLRPFYSKLLETKTNKNSVVNILHIGDSHIQADYLTHTVRALLQQEFGNAGLGLTFPGRAARTNESQQIYSAVKGEWEIDKLTLSQNQSVLGISGMALKTKTTGHAISIRVNAPAYSFNRMTVFFQKDFTHYQIHVKDSTGQILAIAGAFTDEAFPNMSKLVFPYPVNQVQIETNQTLPSQNQFTLYGLSLENSNPGVRYHITGINGARYRHYLAAPELIHQTAALNADLIIVSLGTNEAIDHPNIDPKLRSQIDSLIEELKNVNPNSIILLTTPGDVFKRKTRRNPGVIMVKNKIIASAKSNNLPYWDMFETGGGNRSADRWKKNELLQADGIHFTKKGYELQGELLFEALIKGFNEYVRNRYSQTR